MIPPNYAHLASLTDATGVFEHALHALPRPEHGYCLDDVARALLVTVREPDGDAALGLLAETYLRFVESAITPDGRAHNRRSVDGAWTDSPDVGDWWGRALWALGVATETAPTPLMRHRAFRAFTRAAQQTSPHAHASAYAALGACAVLRVHPGDAASIRLVDRVIAALPPSGDEHWIWPEPRLTYGNASIAEALLLAGVAVHDAYVIDRGLSLVRFLIGLETTDGHLSVTGVDGRGPETEGPMFDQQPIEVAALADAAAAAFDVTGSTEFADVVRLAWSWFEGNNDAGVPMVDHDCGAGFDGLERAGRNDNRGAESTLAALSTWQVARRFARRGVAA